MKDKFALLVLLGVLGSYAVCFAEKLSDEGYACNAKTNGDIRIIDRNGNEHRVSASSTSGKIYVNAKKIIWYCGNSNQDWAPPAGTDYIIVSRKPNGAGLVEYYTKD